MQIYEIISRNFKPIKLFDFTTKIIFVIISNVINIIDMKMLIMGFSKSLYEIISKIGRKYIDIKAFISMFIIAIFLNFTYLFKIKPINNIDIYFIIKKHNM